VTHDVNAPLTVIGSGHQAEILAWTNGRVVKLLRPGLGEALALEEARKTALVHDRGYPAPEVFEPVEVAARHGFVMERLEGATLAALTLASPEHASRLLESFTDLHVQLAGVSGDGLPPLEPRLEAQIAAAPLSETERAEALGCLALCPLGNRAHHGDFHPLNVLSTARGLVVIDWFGARSAHPSADLAKTCLTLRTATLSELPMEQRTRLLSSGLDQAHLARYIARSSVTREQVRLWMKPLAAAMLFNGQQEGFVGRDYEMVKTIATGALQIV
jgi:aminoglycoside phosphotransferase (APT) family kinase protein